MRVEAAVKYFTPPRVHLVVGGVVARNSGLVRRILSPLTHAEGV
jgi:hypothetical protein